MSSSLRCVCGQQSANDSSFTRHVTRCGVAIRHSDRVYQHARHSKRTIEDVGALPRSSKWKSRRLHPECAEASTPSPHKSRRAQMGALSASKLRSMQAQHSVSSYIVIAFFLRLITDVQSDQNQDILPIEDVSSVPDTPFSWSAEDFPHDEPPTTTITASPHVNNAPLGKHIRRPSAKVREATSDMLPEGPGPLGNAEPSPSHVLPSRICLLVTESFRTLINSFGIMREYRGRPSRVPDADVGFDQLRGDSVATPGNQGPKAIAEIIHPYPNMSSFLLNKWFWNRGANKSKADRKELIENVLSHPDFKTEDLRGVNMDKLDAHVAQDADSPWEGNGWLNSTVTIDIPLGEKLTKSNKRQRAKDLQTARRHGEIDPDAPEVPTIRFNIPNFRHRSLLTIIREVFTSPPSKQFHFHPFKQYWKPMHSDVEPEHVFDEMYTSEAFLAADRELQSSPRGTDCDLPRAVAGFMFWSDATHVAQFGQAKLWPIYAYFANQSKYERCRPTAHAARCVAYLHAVSVALMSKYLKVKLLHPSCLIP